MGLEPRQLIERETVATQHVGVGITVLLTYSHSVALALTCDLLFKNASDINLCMVQYRKTIQYFPATAFSDTLLVTFTPPLLTSVINLSLQVSLIIHSSLSSPIQLSYSNSVYPAKKGKSGTAEHCRTQTLSANVTRRDVLKILCRKSSRLTSNQLTLS